MMVPPKMRADPLTAAAVTMMMYVITGRYHALGSRGDPPVACLRSNTSTESVRPVRAGKVHQPVNEELRDRLQSQQPP